MKDSPRDLALFMNSLLSSHCYLVDSVLVPCFGLTAERTGLLTTRMTTLNINNLNHSDTGGYYCLAATSVLGRDLSDTANVNLVVQGKTQPASHINMVLHFDLPAAKTSAVNFACVQELGIRLGMRLPLPLAGCMGGVGRGSPSMQNFFLACCKSDTFLCLL